MSFFKNLFSKQAPPDEPQGADSFSFGVEREMKESGEKGGTEDINIGVGELQEATDGGGPSGPDSFSFGVEREMKESGEKGGTEDINIGVGELQEVTISKSMDLTTEDPVSEVSGVDPDPFVPGDNLAGPGAPAGGEEAWPAKWYVPELDADRTSEQGAGFMKESQETGPQPHLAAFGDGSVKPAEFEPGTEVSGVEPDPFIPGDNLATPGAPGIDEEAWPVKWKLGETDPEAQETEDAGIILQNAGPGALGEDAGIILQNPDPGARGQDAGIILQNTGPEGVEEDAGIILQNAGPEATKEDAGIIIIDGKPEDIDDGPATLTHLGSSGPGLTPLPGSLADAADASDLDDVEAPDL